MNQMAGQQNQCPRCGAGMTLAGVCYNQLCSGYGLRESQRYGETNFQFEARQSIERIEKELSQQGAMLREILGLLKG